MRFVQSDKHAVSTLCVLLFAPFTVNAADDLDHMVITGTRSANAVADLTSNIAFVEAADLQRTSATHINESLSRVAGVWMSRGNGQEHLTSIRSPVLTGAGSCGAFYMAVDGISLRAPGFCNANELFGINSEQAAAIEVIRGPGSVVYGANAVHGIINVVSPSWNELSDVSMGVEAGPHDYGRLKASAKSRMSDHKLAVYGNGTYDGGYKDSSGYDQQKLNVLHEFQTQNWQVTNRVSFTNLNQETAGFIEGFKAYEDQTLKKLNPNPEAFRDSVSIMAYSEIIFAGETSQQVTIKPYYRFHDMRFLQHFVPWQALEENGHSSIGLQATMTQRTDTMVFAWGADVDLTRGWLKESQAEEFSAMIPQGIHYDYDVDAQTLSPFAELNWNVTDALLLSFGARYEYLGYDYDNQLLSTSACAPGVEGCRFSRPDDQRVSFENVSARWGVSFQFTESHHLYMQLSNGYRPPQATELFRLQAEQLIADLESENLMALEFGVRGQAYFRDQQIYYDVTWFSMEKDNHIFQDGERQIVSNGATSHRGMEINLQWQVTPSWSVALAATSAEHEYDENVNISSDADIKGNEIDTAPDLLANVSVLWQNADRYVELEWLQMGSYYLDPANTAEYSGHQLLHLRSGFAIGDGVRAGVRVMNVLDEDYAERADFAFGDYRYFVGEPRSLYATVEFSM